MPREAAHFEMVKENNRKLIRNLVRQHEVLGKAELVTCSGLSFPTVSAALNELVKTGEVLALEGSSNGGRPGAVFKLNPDYRQIACAILNGLNFEIKIYDACGGHSGACSEKIDETFDADQLILIFEKIKSVYSKLEMLVMGIPGVAVDGVIKHLPYLAKLEGVNIQEVFKDKLNIKLFIENDVNAMVIGEKENWKNFAHLFLSEGCIGSGILIDGRLLRGVHGYAGEVELICDEQAEKKVCLTQAALAMACVVDVSDIAISGKEITRADVEDVEKALKEKLSAYRMPKLHYVADDVNLYEKGLWQIALDVCLASD